jgi:pyruvate dehydrogenase E2 component (dihydrolipoamide acetyltransferase)
VIAVAMPRLSDSMEEGTILEWLVSDGTNVRRGDELAEIETDKATMTYEADAEGIMQHVAAEGDTVAVGSTIAHLFAEDEARPASEEHEPVVAVAADANGADSGGEIAPMSPARSVVATVPAGPPSRVKASPLARRVALDLGVELEELTGSGPGGRIVRADVEAAPRPPVVAPRSDDVETVELSRVQRTIARRVSESNASIPDFQVRTEADVTELLALRRAMKDAGRAPSVNDFVVRACALALRDHPRANGTYRDGAFDLHARVNIGVAVAAEGTLVVPTIFDADAKPVTQIAAESRALAARVREGTVTPPDLAGGTFTVSNLGMFGVTSFTAVINAGQAAILAVGAAVERPVIRDGDIVARSVMDLSLSCDHRILYGADAAAFLADVRGLLEQPVALLS